MRHVTLAFAFLVLGFGAQSNAQSKHNIQTVFIILMENHNWTGTHNATSIEGSRYAPYINSVLLPMASHTEEYFNPPAIHPSLPNYLWLEAGTNFGILNDDPPSVNSQTTTEHLVTLLNNAKVSWKAYEEDISGTVCPLTDTGEYAVKHDPFVYFDDVTNNQDPNSTYCIAHVRPFTELASDLQNGTVAQYNFITNWKRNQAGRHLVVAKRTHDPEFRGLHERRSIIHYLGRSRLRRWTDWNDRVVTVRKRQWLREFHLLYPRLHVAHL